MKWSRKIRKARGEGRGCYDWWIKWIEKWEEWGAWKREREQSLLARLCICALSKLLDLLWYAHTRKHTRSPLTTVCKGNNGRHTHAQTQCCAAIYDTSPFLQPLWPTWRGSPLRCLLALTHRNILPIHLSPLLFRCLLRPLPSLPPPTPPSTLNVSAGSDSLDAKPPHLTSLFAACLPPPSLHIHGLTRVAVYLHVSAVSLPLSCFAFHPWYQLEQIH